MYTSLFKEVHSCAFQISSMFGPKKLRKFQYWAKINFLIKKGVLESLRSDLYASMPLEHANRGYWQISKSAEEKLLVVIIERLSGKRQIHCAVSGPGRVTGVRELGYVA